MTTTFTIPFVPEDERTINYCTVTVTLAEPLQQYTRTESPSESMIDTRNITELLETDYDLISPHIVTVAIPGYDDATTELLRSLITEDKMRLIY